MWLYRTEFTGITADADVGDQMLLAREGDNSTPDETSRDIKFTHQKFCKQLPNGNEQKSMKHQQSIKAYGLIELVVRVNLTNLRTNANINCQRSLAI